MELEARTVGVLTVAKKFTRPRPVSGSGDMEVFRWSTTSLRPASCLPLPPPPTKCFHQRFTGSSCSGNSLSAWMRLGVLTGKEQSLDSVISEVFSGSNSQSKVVSQLF